MRNVFPEKLITKCDGEIVPHLLEKIKIEHISGSTVRSFIQFVFIVCPSRELPKHIETKVLTTRL